MVAGLLLGTLAATADGAVPAPAQDLGATQTATQAATRIVVAMADYEFAPGEIVVKAGAPVELVLANLGAEDHRLNAVAPDGTVVRSEIPAPGELTVLGTTFTTPGVYEVYCPIRTPDGIPHRDLGMVGTLIVEA
jgi:plastocyanin